MDKIELCAFKKLEIEADQLTERVRSLTARLHDKEEFITKLNGECTELNQRIMTFGRAAEVKLDEMTKRLHDKNRSVTALQKRVEALESKLETKHKKIQALQANCDFWVGQYKVLKSSYGEALVKIEWLRKRGKKCSDQYRMVRSKEKALRLILAVGAKHIKDLKVKLAAEEKRASGELGHYYCREKVEALERENEKLVREVAEFEVAAVSAELKPGERKVISDGTEGPVVEIIKRGAELETEKDNSAYLEKLLRILYGDGWDGITLMDSKTRYRQATKVAEELEVGRENRKVTVLESKIEFLRKLIKALVGDKYELLTLENAEEFAREYHNIKALTQDRQIHMDLIEDLNELLDIANNLADNRLTSIKVLEKRIAGSQWSYDQCFEECRRLRQDIAELRK